MITATNAAKCESLVHNVYKLANTRRAKRESGHVAEVVSVHEALVPATGDFPASRRAALCLTCCSPTHRHPYLAATTTATLSLLARQVLANL